MIIDLLERTLITFNDRLANCPKSVKSAISLLEEYKYSLTPHKKKRILKVLGKVGYELTELQHSNPEYFKREKLDELTRNLVIEIEEFEKELCIKNYLLFLLKNGRVKLSELKEEELVEDAVRYVKIENKVLRLKGLGVCEYIPEEMITRDIGELKKALPPKIFRDVYIILMGKIQKLSSKEDKFLRDYVLEKWGKLSKEYDNSGLKVPIVEYVELVKRSNGEVDGEKIKLYILEESTLIHEMVHYCQFCRKPYEFKSIIYMNKEEYEAKRKREIEAYFISNKVIGNTISIKEAERLANASMHEVF